MLRQFNPARNIMKRKERFTKYMMTVFPQAKDRSLKFGRWGCSRGPVERGFLWLRDACESSYKLDISLSKPMHETKLA